MSRSVASIPGRFTVAAALLASLPLVAPATAQGDIPPDSTEFVTPFAPSYGFGVVVDTDGTVIVARDAAHVAVYARMLAWPNWELQATVPLWSLPDIHGETHCGLAASEDRLALGETSAPGDPVGAVRILHRSGDAWLDEDLIVPPDGLAGDAFGAVLDLSGSTLAVGVAAHGAAGTVYLFTHAGGAWALAAELSGAAPGDGFGSAVSLSGDRLAVASPGATVLGVAGAGTVTIHEDQGGTWPEVARLDNPAADATSAFGGALDLDGERLLVGAAHMDTDAGPEAGGAWVFAQAAAGWSLEALLAPQAPYVQPQALAGWSVGLDADVALLGAPFSDWSFPDPMAMCGVVCRFDRAPDGWHAGQLLAKPMDAGFGEHLGWSVANALGLSVAGEPAWGSGFAPAILVPNPGDAPGDIPAWLDFGYGLAGVSGVPRLQGSGPLTIGSDVTLLLDNARPNALAMAFVSAQALPTPFKGGTLVPLPAFLAGPLATDPSGVILLRWNDLPAGFLAMLVQFAVADTAAPHGVALSHALAAVAQ